MTCMYTCVSVKQEGNNAQHNKVKNFRHAHLKWQTEARDFEVSSWMLLRKTLDYACVLSVSLFLTCQLEVPPAYSTSCQNMSFWPLKYRMNLDAMPLLNGNAGMMACASRVPANQG